jgi:serine/threonine-protein kinase
VALDEPDVEGAAEAAAVVPVAPDPQSGDVIGGYALVELLGRGGAALVFRARRQRDDAVVALKVLAADKVSRPRIVQRFLDEADIASRVRHPTIVESSTWPSSSPPGSARSTPRASCTAT